MRAVNPVFCGNTAARGSLFRGCCQRGESRVRLHARIQYPRATRIREPAQTPDGNLDGRGSLDSSERLLQLVQTLLGPLADEFSGDVQLLQRNPVQLRQGAQ